jgi:hypothetical protein
MKPFAMPQGAAACAAALELRPAERAVPARQGRARSGGDGPRPPATAANRASAPAAQWRQRNWSRQARSRRVRRGSEPDGNAVHA